jgi:hypothetical protein
MATGNRTQHQIASAPQSLTLSEKTELADHEAAIERGLKTFIDVGLRLATVRDKKLYRSQYASFEDYCEGRWSFSDRRARQLINAAGVVAALPTGTIVPVTESQTRALAGLEPHQAATVMWVAHERTAGNITAAAIRAARAQPWTAAEINVAVDGYQIHPFIACFPAFKVDEWADLVNSIARFGLIQPIMLSADGTTILDGRFRYLALKWNGIDPRTATTRFGAPAMRCEPRYDDDELLVAVIYGVNCLRKAYTPEEVAAVQAQIDGAVVDR